MRILFDWDGTLAKPEVAMEALKRRLSYLGKDIDPAWLKQAMHNNDHYALNKELISKKTGIKDDRELTILMTNLFKKYYTQVASEMKEKIFYEGMIEALKTLEDEGHELSIASTLRQDILDDATQRFLVASRFKKIYANTPDLQYSKEDIVRKAQNELGTIDFMIGDKREDIDAGKSIGAQTIYVMWGATGKSLIGVANYSAERPLDMLGIIQRTQKIN